MTVSRRGRIIWKIGDLIDRHLEEFAELDSTQAGTRRPNSPW
jgi:acyl-CoA reductase-like NAD-dependent aldehyde dehydrogenase